MTDFVQRSWRPTTCREGISPTPESSYPQWFSAFLADRAMRAAFAAYAETHEPATIRRCWSTWNTLCAFLQTSDRITTNPMSLVGRPKMPRSLPKGLGGEAVAGLLAAIDSDGGSRHRSDWPERDRALVLTGVLSGLRADEIIGANVGDIRITDDGGVIHVRGKGNKDRRIPVEQSLLGVLERYLDSRAARFPARTGSRPASTGMGAWPATAALFVGSDGERITRGVLQYRVLRAFACFPRRYVRNYVARLDACKLS